MKTKVITVLVVLIVFFQMRAQDEDFNLAGISYTFNPAVSLDSPSNQQLGETEINISEFRAFFLAPFKLKNDKTTLLAGVDYTFLGGPLNDLPNDRSVDANLHALKFSAGINQRLSDNWAVRAIISPTIASDFSGSLRSDAFTLQASGLVRRITNNGIKYGLGAAYTNGFGEPQLVPIGEFVYRSGNWDVLILAPVQAAVQYRLNKLILGFRVDLQGNEYALNLEDTNRNMGQVESVKFSRYNIGPTIATDLSKSVRLQLSGGLSLARKLRATDVNGDTEDYGLENGAFLKASFLLIK
ncbi:DUF6268 family outer membrane beta-barrel protein [Allomuricauda sp. SCSIO 65647]|uniref:DUF6268 family outer membrane beta-barrel protein n=1 Tax=Allomuricauda sp. SCSIO 65647 TaxID=2908843 RepID=UPI001F1E1F1E|nr:DUF6268 family outer membrane beta-barrel protein [Muricauda sp. SCSIO 65647]UJH66389.1 DUF6268 family outer membrane beta-barrel protein [Muricauda sp. SCSIO 65647]